MVSETAAAAFPRGGGEMEELIRSFDWALTPLGPAAEWPQSLRTALGIVLDSGYPMYIAWGPELIQLYNDAYRPFLGDRHPAIGRSAPETFPDTWGSLGPVFRRVLETGEAATLKDPVLPLEQKLCAIRDEAGLAGGVLVTVIETLAQAAAESHSARLYRQAKQELEERKRVEAALRESEERFRHMADHAPVMVWVTEADGSCSFLSKSWYDTTGQTPESGLGRGRLGTIHPDDRAAARDAFQVAQAFREPFRVEYRFRRRDGEYGWAIDTAVPRFAADGTFLGHIGSVIDITQEKSQEEALRYSERLYRAIGESIDYGVWVCDPEGRNLYASDSFLRLVGMSQEQCSNFGWGEVLHPDDLEATLASWHDTVAIGREWDREHRFRGVDGRWHPILARGVPVKNERGEIIAWAGINLDISRLKQVENELREADQRKDEFLATLAHELRNPLAPISNGLELLKLADDPETAAEARGMMERQLRHLVRLIDDLLDMSRISGGRIELRLERIDLASVVLNAIETSRPLLLERGHQLTVSMPPEPVFVEADVARLAQVFSNLLNNAAKYTGKGGHVRLSVERPGNDVVVRVADDGVGIPSAMLPKVFDLFVQVDQSLERTQGGLGIGLTIVKRLVEMHGGMVEAQSEGPGKGSEFVVSLPVLPAAAGPRAPLAHASGPTRTERPSCRILVADDSEESAVSLAMILKRMGHETRAVHDGQAAVEAAAEWRPRVILLDIGMPRLNGYDACRRIRQEPWGKDVMVIALTGWGQSGDRLRSQEAGFDHHFVKPLELAALEKLLAGL